MKTAIKCSRSLVEISRKCVKVPSPQLFSIEIEFLKKVKEMETFDNIYWYIFSTKGLELFFACFHSSFALLIQYSAKLTCSSEVTLLHVYVHV